jgi:hypothetical protein
VKSPRHKEAEARKMVYTIDERQLLRVWSVICCFAEMRKIQDPMAQSEILTKAQMLLTAFVLDLKQLPEEQAGSATLRDGLNQMVRLAA